MKPDVVADVGNTRMKWGLCRAGAVRESASLPLDDPSAWAAQASAWGVDSASAWALAGVRPQELGRLEAWVKGRGGAVAVFRHNAELPLAVRVDHPERVGVDRLLNAVAVRARGESAFIVDAGSAVTVDWVDADGAFRGGAIFPGIRLMALALHRFTALLPPVEVRTPRPPMPGLSTEGAIEAGVYWAVAGGAAALVQRLVEVSGGGPHATFLTGGDAPLLVPAFGPDVRVWANMTLEGVRLVAEALP